MAAIRIEGLRKYYGPVQALAGLDLQVEPGTVFGFLGPNGAGKSTTIRILTGLAHATAGRAWVMGEDITTPGQDVAHRIGYLPEEPAFYPWMTPEEFLDHVGRVFELSRRDRAGRVKELLEMVGLTEVGRRRIGGFSRGMRQRLGLAQALVNRPEVLFLDEALSGLDPAGRKDILELIKQFSGQSTVFLSTHILADIERVCDTIAIIADGKLVIQSPRDDLLAQYAIPAFEVEVENGLEKPLNHWVKALRKKDWVQSVSIKGLKVRIIVDDIQAAKQELMTSAIETGLVVIRYEMLRPSLEDVFLRLVGEGKSL